MLGAACGRQPRPSDRGMDLATETSQFVWPRGEHADASPTTAVARVNGEAVTGGEVERRWWLARPAPRQGTAGANGPDAAPVGGTGRANLITRRLLEGAAEREKTEVLPADVDPPWEIRQSSPTQMRR